MYFTKKGYKEFLKYCQVMREKEKKFFYGESKYYTPSIEEFHVGFEYEFKEGDRWIPCEFNFNQNIKSRKLDDIIRVKYLDKEDIESCGFIDLGSLWFFKEQCLTVNDVNNLNCKIRKWKNNQIDIYADYRDNDELQLIFRGCIKNKSELKRLLQWLGIQE